MNIRRATNNDARFLFDLRNEPEVRMASWNHDLVEFTDHQKWVTSTLSNPKRVLYVVEAESGKPVGQVRYDIIEKNYAEVSVSILRNHTGKGYGTIALTESTKVFFVDFPEVKKITAHIKRDNSGSVKAFTRAGYSDPVKVIYNGHDCMEMGFCRTHN